MPSAKYKWWVVAMLWSICFFNYADRQAVFSVFPKLKEEYGFDKTQLGLIGSAFMWVYAAGAPLAGYAGDRFVRKHLILGGCVFWSFVTMLTGWCGRLWQFVAVRALEGLGEAFYFPASTSLISDYHNLSTRSRALGFHNSSVYLGTIAGGWIGAWFAEMIGWRFGFFVLGGAGMVLALIIYRGLREPVRGAVDCAGAECEQPPGLLLREVPGAVFRSPVVWLLLGAFIGANFVATVFLAWTPTFLVEKFNLRITAAGASGTMAIHLASALSAPASGWLADRLAARVPSGRMLVQASGLLAGAGFVFLVGTTDRLGHLLTGMALFGFCKGLYDANIFASLFDVVETRARSTAAGIMNTAGWGGGALGPLTVGWISQHGRHASEMANMSEAIARCSIVYLVSAGLLVAAALIYEKRQQRRRKHEFLNEK